MMPFRVGDGHTDTGWHPGERDRSPPHQCRDRAPPRSTPHAARRTQL